MTTERRDKSQQTPFSAWLQEHPELDSREYKISATDSDMWCHRFSVRNEHKRRQSTDIRDAVDSIMLVEIKTYFAGQSYAQHDTLSVVDALMRQSCMRNGRRYPVAIKDNRLGNRKDRMVRFFGVHLLQLSADRPDRSREMLWDERHFIHESHLIELLRFERDPDSPTRPLDTRRHHKRPGDDGAQLSLVA